MNETNESPVDLDISSDGETLFLQLAEKDVGTIAVLLTVDQARNIANVLLAACDEIDMGHALNG